MHRYNLKPLTESSWLLFKNGERLGLVSEVDNKIKYLNLNKSKEYNSFEEFKKSLDGRVVIDPPPEPQVEKEAGNIEGYPIKHAEFYNVQPDPVPSYTRTLKSDSRYAAGYYAVKFSNGWTGGFCPKLATLADYEYIGPYTTRLEMKHQISIKNKSTNV